MANPRFELVVNGKRYSGWQEIDLVRSMEFAADEFHVLCTNRWQVEERKTIRAGSAVELFLDNELLVTGYIDSVDANYSAKDSSLAFRGRSRLADIVDCSLASISGKTQFDNQTLVQLANKACVLFGIKVIDRANAATPFKTTALTEGEPVWVWLEELARIRAVRLMGTPSGELLITRTGTQRSATSLVLGDNIRSASGIFDFTDRFSEYSVAANQDAVQTINPKEHTVVASSNDDVFGKQRYRPLVLRNESPADAIDVGARADWEMRVRAGRSQQLTYSIGGWQQDDGKSWAPNTLVSVRDEFIGIDDELLIVTARMILDADGPRSELTVMPKAAMDLIPLPEPQAEGTWGVMQ